MSITSAGIHANKLWNRAFRKMEIEGFTPKRKRKTLLQALSEARKNMTHEQRVEHLLNSICKS